MILHGDCLDLLPTLDAESIDAIVTDPPYELGFMGRAWDRSGIAFRVDVWRDLLRVAKPGAHLLAFGGTRTVHRIAVAIEDAGWEIRDCLVWGYASGFPKSRNLDGDWAGWGTGLKPAWEPIVLARKPLRGTVAANVLAYGTGALNIDGCRIGTGEGGTRNGEATATARYGARGIGFQPTPGPRGGDAAGRWPSNVILTDNIFDGDTPGVVGGGETTSGKMQPTEVRNRRTVFGQDAGDGYTTIETYGDSGTYSRFFLIPRRYNEPCSECGRVSDADASSSPRNLSGATVPEVAQTSPDGTQEASTASDTAATSRGIGLTTSVAETTSWLDDDASTPSIPRSRPRETLPASGRTSSRAKSRDAASPATDTTTTTPAPSTCATCAGHTTSRTTSTSSVRRGSPADGEDYPRFLLFPKAARSDREPVLRGQVEERSAAEITGRAEGSAGLAHPRAMVTSARENVHPTVKPTELMRHLVRLVTPPGGIVLDPFLGSGTTALAAEMEGFGWVGIEREAEYVAIAEARLNGTQRGLGLSA